MAVTFFVDLNLLVDERDVAEHVHGRVGAMPSVPTPTCRRVMLGDWRRGAISPRLFNNAVGQAVMDDDGLRFGLPRSPAGG